MSLSTEVPGTYVYTRAQHRFFDDLVTMLAAMTAFGVGVRTYGGRPGPFPPNLRASLGSTDRTDLTFDPNPLLEAITAGKRPERIELRRVVTVVRGEPEPSFHIVLGLILQAAFVHYYESVLDLIEDVHGDKYDKWPSVLHFAWAVRNAFAHGGKIYFKSSKTAPVSWREFTYSHSDNNRQILYTDLQPADVVFLMDDMDQAF